MLFFEQLGKAAGGRVADHLRDLPHGEVGVYKQVLRLAHSPPLNVLRDAASELPLEAALELRLAHAGDARKALERDIKGVVVGNVADHVLQPLCVRRRLRGRSPSTAPPD